PARSTTSETLASAKPRWANTIRAASRNCDRVCSVVLHCRPAPRPLRTVTAPPRTPGSPRAPVASLRRRRSRGTADRYGGLAVVLPAPLHPHAGVNGVGVGVDLREQAEALVEVDVRDDVGGAGPEVRVPVPAHDRVRVHDAAAGRVAHLPAV